MIDFNHIAEGLASSLFVAGVAWGTMKAEAKGIKDRIGDIVARMRDHDIKDDGRFNRVSDRIDKILTRQIDD